MKQFDFTVHDEYGIHARPAGLLVREAQKFTSNIQAICEGKTIDLKRLFSVMEAGIKQGDHIIITASGEDEALAAQSLEKFVKANF
jgi:phosphocarrier protein HPr